MTKMSKTRYAKIYMAGDITLARLVCARLCKRQGLCVSLKPVDYVYNGGMESGFEVMLINYPKFPDKSHSELIKKAIELATELMKALAQDSYLVMGKKETYWHTDRD